MQGSVNEKQGLLNIMNCPWIIFLLFWGEVFASTTYKQVRSIEIDGLGLPGQLSLRHLIPIINTQMI